MIIPLSRTRYKEACESLLRNNEQCLCRVSTLMKTTFVLGKPVELRGLSSSIAVLRRTLGKFAQDRNDSRGFSYDEQRIVGGNRQQAINAGDVERGSLPFDPATIWHQNRSRNRRKRVAMCAETSIPVKTESHWIAVCRFTPRASLRSLLARAVIVNKCLSRARLRTNERSNS